MVSPEISSDDLYLFNEGTHYRLYDVLGAHLVRQVEPGAGAAGVRFAVWAPDAAAVSVIGDFNGWQADASPMTAIGQSGIWTAVVATAGVGTIYKYAITSRHTGATVEKADPYGFRAEHPPRTASIVSELTYQWQDAGWMASRAAKNHRHAPISIYEVHLSSWMREHGEHGAELPLPQLAERLADYVSHHGFTHVELMPIMAHPFHGSWGYQVTGYFAPAARFGSPDEMMLLIDTLHRRGIGVILDWVPAHFPMDEHALAQFDGSHLYEHADPRKGFHPDWTSAIFNYGRKEVQAFLLSSAMFWLERYHADGLRVDGVASMLYLDYSRKEGEWVPNEDGSNENRDAVAFLRRFNEVIYAEHPDVQTYAEESTAWAGVTRPTSAGGLGFGFKWDMGWMHDSLGYMSREPIHRKFHHDEITFRAVYGYTENFVLPLSHDEVVHGKGSLYGKMPGDDWQKRANLRTLLGFMYGTPGKKLLFMGSELGGNREWNHDGVLEWDLSAQPEHGGIQRWVRDLNHAYREQPALHQGDVEPGGFAWTSVGDREGSTLAFVRRGLRDAPPVVVACNFTPVPRSSYRLQVPGGGTWREVLNSDAEWYGGSGIGNLGQVEASSHHGEMATIDVVLPPLSIVFFVREVG